MARSVKISNPYDGYVLNQVVSFPDEEAARIVFAGLGVYTDQPVAGALRPYGLLSERSLPAFWKDYYFFATDVNGGTLYYSTGTTWLQAAKGVSEGGSGGGGGIAWRGAWASASTYAIGDVVSWGGSSYYATATHAANTAPPTGTSGSPGTDDTAVTTGWALLAQQGATGATGTGTPGTPGQGFTWRGPWVTATAYAAYDVVTDSGNTYFVNTAHTSAAAFSTNAAKMTLMAAKGADGVGGGGSGGGVPAGGTAGMALVKSSSTDYASAWETLTASRVSDFNEAALDYIGGVLVSGAGPTLAYTFNDTGNTLISSIASGSITETQLSAPLLARIVALEETLADFLNTYVPVYGAAALILNTATPTAPEAATYPPNSAWIGA